MNRSFFLGLVVGFAALIVRETLALFRRDDHRKMIADGVQRIAAALESLDKRP